MRSLLISYLENYDLVNCSRTAGLAFRIIAAENNTTMTGKLGQSIPTSGKVLSRNLFRTSIDECIFLQFAKGFADYRPKWPNQGIGILFN